MALEFLFNSWPTRKLKNTIEYVTIKALYFKKKSGLFRETGYFGIHDELRLLQVLVSFEFLQ